MTFTPLLCASTRAFAIGAEVKEYAWTRTSFFAFPSSRTTASVAPPWGEKKTSVTCAANGPADTDLVGEEQANVNVSRKARTRAMMERRLPLFFQEVQECFVV